MPNCNSCKATKPDYNANQTVPYIVFESAQARYERSEKRHWIAHIISFVVIALVVGFFLLYLNQYDFEAYSYEYEQDGMGINIIGDSNRGVNNDVTTSFGAPENPD